MSAVGAPEGITAAVAAETARRVPGLSLAVVSRDGSGWTQGFGVADLAIGRAATPLTAYMWFSMTKIVTATAVLQLSDRGHVNLDSPVTEYLTEFAETFSRTGMPAATVRHLLSHSAGLANPIPVSWVHAATEPGRDVSSFTRDLLAKNARLKYPPGTRASYSNLGYLVLGELVARVSGRSYTQYVTEHLLDPLGMNATGFTYEAGALDEAATGYQPRWSPMTLLLRLMLPKGILGASAGKYVGFNRFYVDGPSYGGLIGTVEDAARFLALHLNGGVANGERLISAESVQAMQRITATSSKLDVGLGWFRQRPVKNPPRFLEHLGGGAGFWNDMRIYPDDGVGVIVMGNSTRYDHERIIEAALASKAVLGKTSEA